MTPLPVDEARRRALVAGEAERISPVRDAVVSVLRSSPELAFTAAEVMDYVDRKGPRRTMSDVVEAMVDLVREGLVLEITAPGILARFHWAGDPPVPPPVTEGGP